MISEETKLKEHKYIVRS
jgi:hypothetical protein